MDNEPNDFTTIQPETPQPKRSFKELVKANFTHNFLALLGALVITGIVLYGWVSYLAWSNFNEVKRAAEDGQQKQQELQQKRAEQKAQDPTADWQTYRNDEYGFEFKYPANYEIYSDSTNLGLMKEIVLFEQDDSRTVYDYTIVGVASDLSIKQGKEICASEESGAPCFSFEPLLCDGNICTLYDFNHLSGLQKRVDIKKNQNYVTLQQGFGDYKGEPEEYPKSDAELRDFVQNKTLTKKSLDQLNTFNQILSTFKFIELTEQELIEADVKKIADINQFRVAAELYYDKYKMYPRAIGNTSESHWQSFSNMVSDEKIMSAEIIMGLPYDYQTDPSQQSAVFRAVLEAPDNENVKRAASRQDIDGIIYGIDCNKPNYCLLIDQK